ncbi:MAG: PilZ domain-containing protein [Deltaproteobacteria bacterium]|nr:PilZ domain-containing protein [Deltaproteobacteria bacterium]
MPDEPLQEHKRRSLRVPIIVTRVRVDHEGNVFFGYAKNISKAGLFIQTINPKNIGERFNVEFCLPGESDLFSCTVEVIWKRDFPQSEKYEPGMGLKFINLSPVQADLLEAWINQDAEIVEESI